MPDESLLLMPDEWRAELLPRRGVRPGEVFEADGDASALWRKYLAAHDPALRTAIAAATNHDAAEYLDGKPNVLGAGLVAVMAAIESPHHRNSKVRPVFDAWIEEHGLPFAIGAAVAVLSLESARGTSIPTFGSLVEYEMRRIHERPLSSMSGVLFLKNDFHLLRGLLADVPDEEYAAAEAAVERLRDTPARKYLAALLFPDRTDWVDEAAEEVAKEAWTELLTSRLAHSVTSLDQLAAMRVRTIEAYAQHAGLIPPLLDGLGAQALPLLTAPTRHLLEPEQTRERVQAIALLPHDEATTYLVEHIAERFVFDAAVTAAARFPLRMLRALARHASQAQPAHLPLLASLALRVDARAQEALAETDRTSVTWLVSQLRPVPDAAEANLPELLVRPPWTVKRPKRKPIVVPGLEPDDEETVIWSEGERERYWESTEEIRLGYIEDWDRRLGRNGDAWCELLVYAPASIADARLETWSGDFGGLSSDVRATILARGLLARYGVAVADHLLKFLAVKPRLGALLGPIRSAEAARLAAHWYANLKSVKEHGAAWLDRHGAAAAELLVPNALGTSKTDRSSAAVALLRIAEIHGPDTILDAAEVYGHAARAGVEALLETAAAGTLPDRIPNPGDWFDPTRLPQVLLHNRDSALPESSMRHVAVVMAIAVDIKDDPRLAELTETCDHDSLQEFSWAVFEQWLASGAPSADRWALAALRFFGDDVTVARLTPMIKAWPGQNQHHRAVAGLRVLGAIGSETALRAMLHISQRAKFKAIKAEAAQQMQVIAKSLGLTGEQLADRLLPDFGLGNDGVLVLDYGPRKFKVVFDEQLRPYVTDEAGKPRKVLPKPGAKDDPELAGAAYQRFAALKKELRTVSVDQVRRLEAAMINARTWERDEFEEYMHGHPLMRYLTRRMIWLAHAPDQRLSFRIAEDNTFTDAEDDSVSLPGDAVIRLAHPIDMTAEEQGAWARLLADYEILQPFEQLGRPVMAFTEAELETGRLLRFENAVVPPGAILGLTKHGWVRGKPQDNGIEFGFHFPLPEGGYVAVELSPGLQIGLGADTDDQCLERVFLTHRLDDYYRGHSTGHPTRIDPVIASEVLAALDRLTAEE
ncbi:MolR family transcriptional regulator [Glycomyces algeriensis]|uniref:MolR family transcriptional regulator n=1 Tax=Glycomyces algeriensis TaxID=256037 RepID=A0A9W6LF27_9ACTN|nr:MolR family transcriptional regulator [Glycomyces algeriensis]